MKKSIILISILFSLISSINSAQTVGKILSKSEATVLFGDVIESVTLTRDQLDGYLAKTNKSMMFKIIKGQVIVLGDDRIALSPGTNGVEEKEVFSLFSKSKIIELLSLADTNTILVEQRQKVLTITYEQNCLEFSGDCPPNCI